MPRPTPTEIRIDERGDEAHESWLLIRANRISASPGSRLFDSEIAHQHFIRVTVSRCTRKRDLRRDLLHATTVLLEMDMSEAQWGAFVSSFGSGSGVPATLSFFDGAMVPEPTVVDSRLAKSHDEVKATSARAVEEIRAAEQAVQDAFERGAGKREMRDLLRTLRVRTENLPSNMEFAAKSLTEHVENVVTRARADVESMVVLAARSGLVLEGLTFPVLEIKAADDVTLEG
jgi:hypothetical protein